jgi:hypothetical protein
LPPKKGLVQKAKMGGTLTRAPIGYLNVRKLIEGREVRTVEVDPERAPYIRWAFAAYGSGAYTLDTLLAALTDRDLRTRPTVKKPERPISRSQLASMLQNPYYVGIVRYAGVEYEVRHKYLIDKASFDKAKTVLAAHNHAAEKDRKHHHYLKGSLYCGRCGSRPPLATSPRRWPRALDLLADCQRVYLAAPGHLRRQWNQALFERLVVYDERIAGVEVAEPFAILADPGPPARLDGEAVTGTGASFGGGSNEELLIGAPGFEPGTSPTRTVRATRLRHAPKGAIISERRGVGRSAVGQVKPAAGD